MQCIRHAKSEEKWLKECHEKHEKWCWCCWHRRQMRLAWRCPAAAQSWEDPVYLPSRADWRCGSAGRSLGLASAAVHQQLLRRSDHSLPRSAVGATYVDTPDRPATPSQETLSPSAKLRAVHAAPEGPNSTNLQCLPRQWVLVPLRMGVSRGSS